MQLRHRKVGCVLMGCVREDGKPPPFSETGSKMGEPPLKIGEFQMSLPISGGQSEAWSPTGRDQAPMARGWPAAMLSFPRAHQPGHQWPVPTMGTPSCAGAGRGRAPCPLWNRAGGAGRVAMEIFSLADALGRCKKSSAPLAVRHNASRILQKQEASATGCCQPNGHYCHHCHHCHHRHHCHQPPCPCPCGETESPPKGTLSSWCHLPQPQSV